jgi:eukaryotic-like serine/threonine-protein kinase
LRRDDWDEIYARPKPPGMHASTAFLIAFFTSIATSAGTVYVVERFDLMKKQVQAPESVVPDLKGLSESDARANAQSSKVVLLVSAREPSADAKPGAVLRQSIPPGQRVPQQHPVGVVIADALPKVPAVTGLTLPDATKKLEELGYKVAQGDPIADPQAPAGQVLRQDPPAESPAEKGKVVKVVLSSGPGEVVVPKLAGFALAKAKTELEQLGLKPVVRWVSLAETATYVVLNQKPLANEKAKAGSDVEVVVNR